MQTSLLTTKFYFPPVRPAFVHRPRLVDRLQAGLCGPLILVSAPTGSGKTSLLSEWRSGPGSGTPAAWLSLDAADNDSLRFLQYLIAALDTLQPGWLQNIQPFLKASENPNPKAVLTLLVNALEGAAQDFVLILEDYHVIKTTSVHEALSFLLEALPPRMHIIILTRVDPPLPLARLRARGLLTEVRDADLRFTLDEAAEFLNHVMALPLSLEQIRALEGRTEGWIAGMQLAALSMQGCKDIPGFVSAFAGSHHYVMDYLVEEVLKIQTNQMSVFLLQTSILDRLCGPLCEVVVGTDSIGPIDGQAMLEALEEMNLFTIPLDNERRWYRYHHLFADVLRKRLEHQFRDTLPELHRRASLWYEENGFISESIQQAIAAGDQDRAAQLIEQNGCFLLISGEVATLLNWADTIEFESEAHPWLAIQKAWALALTGDLDRIEPTLQAPELLLTPLEPTVEVKTMLGTIAAARAHCANSRGDTQSAADYAQIALEQLPDCSSISRTIRSVAVSILGDASWLNGNLEEAARAYVEAIRIGRKADNLHMVIIASSNLADILMEQGQLRKAAETYTYSLQMAVRPDGQRSPLAEKLYAGLARLAYEYNELELADQYVHQCIDLCRQWGEVDLQAIAFVMLARLEHARGNPGKAQEAIWSAEQLAGKRLLSPRNSLQLKSELASYWIALGNLDKLSQLVQKSALSIEGGIPYIRESEFMLLLRSFLAHNDYEPALALSERLLKLAEPDGRMGLVIETLILQALAFQGKKETAQALAALERAFTLAQPDGYVRTFLDKGEAMTKLLCLTQSRRVGHAYAAVLLSKISKIAGMTQPSMQLLSEPLTAREVEVLKLIESGCSNQEIAAKLVISIPTVKRHISNIYTKLGVESRTQAVAIGKEMKIL